MDHGQSLPVWFLALFGAFSICLGWLLVQHSKKIHAMFEPFDASLNPVSRFMFLPITLKVTGVGFLLWGLALISFLVFGKP